MSQKSNLFLPGNIRYQPKDLVAFFGYDNLYGTAIEVELATMQTLSDIGIIPGADMALLTQEVTDELFAISTTEVDEIERTITQHDVRALVRVMQEILPPPLRRWVHVPLTSFDPLSTGRILQYLRAYRHVLKPKIKNIASIFSGLIHRYAHTKQIGRTHGQHAIPITVGFWLATLVNRIMYNAQKMDDLAEALVGKISGPVGASNAVHGLGIEELCDDRSFEHRVLERLGLDPSPISTQILPPEPLAYFLFSCSMLSATFGQLGRDCRHLMRSEIGEVGEPFAEGQVGSSTMAQKRNPIKFENLEGMWLRTKNEFGKVMDVMISEHQRDLVGSSLERDFPIILVNLTEQLNTLLREDKATKKPFLERLTVNAERCRRNLEMGANLVLAEPIYIALQMAGYAGDAHELINRQAVPLSQKKDQPLMASVKDLAEDQEELGKALVNIPTEVLALLLTPEEYVGTASEQALQMANEAAGFAAWF